MEARIRDLGKIGYLEARAFQEDLVAKVVAGEEISTLLLVEHPPVMTLGAGFHSENLLLAREAYKTRGIEVFETDRGGDVTYHGPGQIVAYPVFDLRGLGKDVHAWLRQIEEVGIETLKPFGLEGSRKPPHTGVWIGDRKICAIGIKVRRWVSMHGLALNVDLDLTAFDLIVPCGISDFGVTSLSQELGRNIDQNVVKSELVRAFERVFSIEWQ